MSGRICSVEIVTPGRASNAVNQKPDSAEAAFRETSHLSERRLPNRRGMSGRICSVEIVTPGRASNAVNQQPDSAEAFAEWVDPHLPVMASLAARLAPGVDPDDVVQESLVRAWKMWHQYDASRGSPRTWLIAITADQARRARRKARPATVLAAFSPPSPSVDDRLDVDGAVARLPTRQRLAVDCFYYVDLSIAETAAVMRCSPGTVKSTLADARKRLRDLLDG